MQCTKIVCADTDISRPIMGKHGEPKGSQLLSSEPLHPVYKCELVIKGLLMGTSEDQLHLPLILKQSQASFLKKEKSQELVFGF